MIRLMVLCCFSLTVTISQGQGISVKTFLLLKTMNQVQCQEWLLRHHFVLLKQEQQQGVKRQTYLGDPKDVMGNHDVLFIVYGPSINPAQYISYSTNVSRFMHFKRDLLTHQFQQVDAYQDSRGNQVIQYQHEQNVIELTTLWSSQSQDNLYTISLLSDTVFRRSHLFLR